MIQSFTDTLEQVIKATRDIWLKGWSENTGGNISVRLHENTVQTQDVFSHNSDWIELDTEFPDLADEYFIMSGTGMFLRNIELSPEETLGVIQLDQTGRCYRCVWGYSNGGRPTSELPSHLRAHSVRKQVSQNTDRVFIHCHCPCLIALSHALELNTAYLTRLLWQMHIECIVVFPDGVEFIPWQRSGSSELGQATAAGLEKRRAIVWQYHGVGAVGPTLDAAFGLIHVLEKSAEIYLKVHSLGGVKNILTTEQMLDLARVFNLTPDPEIINQDIEFR
ncbi:MAG: rhamnulose-1-phosphate aldolase [Planctomycetes bacterium]|nr:rhamnulose-1-phosphate aldolase [Planctomycetota bacterium]